MSSLLVQLRTGKIGFNAFLYARKVPTVLSPRCPCDTGAMTVRHVLLACPTWSVLRMRLLGELRTSDIRVLLNSTTGATAATSFILLTNLLDQFRLVAREAQADGARDNSTESHGCSAPLGSPTIANTEDESSEDEAISTSDTSSGT